MGFLTAPPKTEVLVYYAQYGNVSGAVTNSRGRIWLVAETADPDAVLKAIVATNDPDTGRPVYETFDVESATIRSAFVASIDIVLADGRKLGQAVAPCVCGAGAIGYAGPTEDRHRVTYLDPGNHVRIARP